MMLSPNITSQKYNIRCKDAYAKINCRVDVLAHAQEGSTMENHVEIYHEY